MRYRLLGRSGLRVSELCLGAMVFGDTRGRWGATREDAEEILSRFAEAGGSPFVALQVTYSLIERSVERELLSTPRTRSVG